MYYRAQRAAYGRQLQRKGKEGFKNGRQIIMQQRVQLQQREL